MVRIATFNVLLTLLVVAVTFPQQGPAETKDAAVTVALQSSVRTVPPLLFGSNLQWEHEGDGALAGNGWIPGLIDAIRSGGITSLRFPGGSLSNSYRWKSGTGPRDKRPKGKGFGGGDVPSTFGTDEFIRLCQEVRVQPIMTVNLAAGPEEAADWVEYLNGAAKTREGARRAANGLAPPLDAKYWEIGNELYSPNENGHLKADEYARQVSAFAKAMKARDRSIKIGAHLEASFLQAAWMKNVFPHLLTWNEEVLKGCGKDIDFVVLHFYAPFDKLSNDDKLRQLVWAGPVVFEQNLAMIRDLLKRHARSGVEICVTEYGTFFGEKTAPDPRIGTTENAVFSALLLVACMRASDVTAANHWSLLNNSSFGMLKTDKGRLSSRPTAAVIQGLASMAQGTLLTVKIDCAGAAVDAKGSIPALGQVPDLDGAAVRMADGKLRAALINRSVRNSARTRVRFDGGRGPRAMNVRALSPADAGGSEWKVAGPSKVEAGKDGSFELTVPPGSLVFIESIE